MNMNEELAGYRLSKARDLLVTARLNYENGDFASSVNRSYYAVFNAARALLALKGLDSKKHSGVMSLFNRHFVKTGVMSKESGDTFRYSKIKREDADYADFVVVSQDDAGKELEKAERFVDEAGRKVNEMTEEE